jgi:hypothetical protein
LTHVCILAISIGRSHPRGKASTSIVEVTLSDNLFERIVGLIGQLVPITPLTFPHDSDAAEINDFVPERLRASDKSKRTPGWSPSRRRQLIYDG